MTSVFSPARARCDKQLRRRRRASARTLLASVLVAVCVGGCAPDAWLPDAPYEAFLARVQDKCYYKRIGRVEITREFLDTEPDPYFVDLTSRFYNGEISQAAYVQGLQGAYDAQPDSPGVRCLLAQMPQTGRVPAAATATSR